MPKQREFFHTQYYNPGEEMNYEEIISEFPWIVKKDRNAIISPDCDGFLCGLFMANFYNWKIKGYYDGKVLLLKKGINAKDCIFLDVDIFRKEIKSIGHHMVMFNKLRLSSNWNNYKNCIQPNNIRNYDFYRDFNLKYPLGSIHLLLGIIGSMQEVDIPKSAVCPLLFVDGTWMNLFQYTENSLSWIKYLKAEKITPLSKIFCNEHYSVHTMMIAMDDFLRKRDNICAPRELGARERGDRLIISTADGPYNLDPSGRETYSIKIDGKNRAEEFLTLLSNLTKWNYNCDDWIWGDLKLYNFTKEIFAKQGRLSNRDFERFIESNPLSYAITSNQRIEYTLEAPDSIL